MNILEDEGDEESMGFMNLGSNSRGFNREKPFGMRAKVGRAGEGDYGLRGDNAGEEVEVEEEESSREDDIFVKEEEEDELLSIDLLSVHPS